MVQFAKQRRRRFLQTFFHRRCVTTTRKRTSSSPDLADQVVIYVASWRCAVCVTGSFSGGQCGHFNHIRQNSACREQRSKIVEIQLPENATTYLVSRLGLTRVVPLETVTKFIFLPNGKAYVSKMQDSTDSAPLLFPV
jgi:hypothetical protein